MENKYLMTCGINLEFWENRGGGWDRNKGMEIGDIPFAEKRALVSRVIHAMEEMGSFNFAVTSFTCDFVKSAGIGVVSNHENNPEEYPLIATITVETDRILTGHELSKLHSGILGQLSDGWGENIGARAVAEWSGRRNDYQATIEFDLDSLVFQGQMVPSRRQTRSIG